MEQVTDKLWTTILRFTPPVYFSVNCVRSKARFGLTKRNPYPITGGSGGSGGSSGSSGSGSGKSSGSGNSTGDSGNSTGDSGGGSRSSGSGSGSGKWQ